MVFAVYASLIPFELQFVPFDSAVAEFRSLLLAPYDGRISRTNFLANILLFVPIGFGLAGALLVDRARRLAAIPAAAAILPISIALSLSVEFLQIFAPGRVPSRHDIVAQTIGCLIGIAAWPVIGPGLTAWLRAASNRGRTDRFARLLTGYAVVWAFVNLAPFDITLDPGELARRVRTGMITLVPFGQPGAPTARLVWDAFATTISAVPLGVLGLVGWTGGRVRRDARAAFVPGAVMVVAMEAAQVFIRSHAADMGDAIFGCAGVALGVWIGVRTLSRSRLEIDGASPRRVVSAGAIAALTAWFVVLAAYHWMPYDFTVDSSAISRKLARMSLVPFAGYRSGSDLNALNDLLVKLSLSMPLGLLAALAVRPYRPSTILTAGWLAVAAVVFGTIEFGQLFLPSRVPDPTDVLVGVAGTAAGLWLGRWLQAG